MTPEQWETIRHFNPDENFGDPSKMSYLLLLSLDNLREYIGAPIVIHCGYEDRGNDSYHCKGMAVDCHAKGLSLYDFYFASTRFSFHGIGVYPKWNNPGLHLDIRPVHRYEGRAFWGCTAPGEYVALSAQFIADYLV